MKMTIDELEALLRKEGIENGTKTFKTYHASILSQGKSIQGDRLLDKWEIALQRVDPRTPKTSIYHKGRKQINNYTPFGQYMIAEFKGQSLKSVSIYYGIPYPTFINYLQTEISRVSSKVRGLVTIGLVKKTGKTAFQISREISSLGQTNVTVRRQCLGKVGVYVMGHFEGMTRVEVAEYVDVELAILSSQLRKDVMNSHPTSIAIAKITRGIFRKTGKKLDDIRREMDKMRRVGI